MLELMKICTKIRFFAMYLKNGNDKKVFFLFLIFFTEINNLPSLNKYCNYIKL